MEFNKMNPGLQIDKERKRDKYFKLAPQTLLTIIASK